MKYCHFCQTYYNTPHDCPVNSYNFTKDQLMPDWPKEHKDYESVVTQKDIKDLQDIVKNLETTLILVLEKILKLEKSGSGNK